MDQVYVERHWRQFVPLLSAVKNVVGDILDCDDIMDRVNRYILSPTTKWTAATKWTATALTYRYVCTFAERTMHVTRQARKSERGRERARRRNKSFFRLQGRAHSNCRTPCHGHVSWVRTSSTGLHNQMAQRPCSGEAKQKHVKWDFFLIFTFVWGGKANRRF